MAIFQTRVQIISRAGGKSVVAAAAYRAACRLEDERSGRAHDFAHKGDLLHADILLPQGAPDGLGTRERLWNAVEAGEKRKDAQLARDVEFSLPHELSEAENIELAREIVQELFVSRGMIADLAVHRGEPMPDGGGTKIHAHVLLTLRRVGPAGFGPKERSWNARDLVEDWREQLATRVNQRLAARGIEARVDHRSYAERSLAIEGRSYTATELRTGRMAEQAAVVARNAQRITADPTVALDVLTEHQATFTRRDLARFVNRHTKDADAFRTVLARIEASPELVRLGVDSRGEERFSTREMIATEQRLQAHAAVLATSTQHGVRPSLRQEAVTSPELGVEQKTALAHLLTDEGLVLLVGFAGSGKSRLLGAAREVWERAGYRVRGAALAGIAAEGLEIGSGIRSRTIASLEHAWKKGREQLTRGEILVVDEAGMVGSRQLERVLAAARAAQTKVVLVGDPEQLQAIEAGAAFRALLDRHRSARLGQVRRQTSVWMQAATRELASGNTAEALRRYAGAGMVHASPTREAALEKLVAQWAFDRIERPARSQLILAYTHADVRALNEAARMRMRESNLLEEDHAVPTERGTRQMAVGDRVLFLRNERGLGVKNGSLGELRSLRGSVLEVQLDEAGKRGAGALIQFDLRDYASLDHGYATTIHKSQGSTVGRSYVLAGAAMDRHATYVALTRHTGRSDLHYGRDEFQDEVQLAARLGRERAKDTTLDYAGEVPTEARNSVAASEVRTLDRDELPTVADTRTGDAVLDARTRAALERVKARLREERQAGQQQAWQTSGLAQAVIAVRDLFKSREARSRSDAGRGR